jgi:hypothetical protein
MGLRGGGVGGMAMVLCIYLTVTALLPHLPTLGAP